MSNPGKFLIVIGLGIALIGVCVGVSSGFKIPFLGKLPGDIFVQNKNFTFYFPFTTCLIISLVLSLIFYFIFRK